MTEKEKVYEQISARLVNIKDKLTILGQIIAAPPDPEFEEEITVSSIIQSTIEELTTWRNQLEGDSPELEVLNISYKALANLGDYQNESVEITAKATVSNKDEVLKKLKQWVWENLNSQKEYSEIQDRQYQARRSLREMRDNVTEAYKEYEKQATFLKAQGIPINEVTPPNLEVLALPGKQEEVVEAEF